MILVQQLLQNFQCLQFGRKYNLSFRLQADDFKNNPLIANNVYYITIPYNSSHSDDIIWLLNNAKNNNVFIQSRLFVGRIIPAGDGAMIGYMYYTQNSWYGSVAVIYGNKSGVYACGNQGFSKQY